MCLRKNHALLVHICKTLKYAERRLTYGAKSIHDLTTENFQNDLIEEKAHGN